MPQIFPKNIISFSSEDKAFPASNLLKSSSFNKWRSAKGGTPREVVELDFGEPVEVSRLDIGNNGSAFIEVLVRRSASSDDPMVFVPCSSFMSPMDAKNETNLTRVRVFSGEQLYDVAAKQKWDIFRLVCTQPFNKTLSYGISFVSFHSPAPKYQPSASEVNTASDSLLLDDYEIENDSPDFRPGALFQAAKANPSLTISQPSVSKPTTVAEKLRAANQSASCAQLTDSSISGRSVNPTVSKPATLSNSSQPTPKHSKPSVMSSGRSNPASPQPSASNVQPTPTSTNNKGNQSRTSPQPHKHQPSTSTASNSNRHPLAGVVFSLSGYQNPLRSELRQKALALGAKFRQDWDRDCTHLICAFPNTPKFKEVSGKGIIVSDKWIQQCHATKSMANWRPYRVGRAPSPPNRQSSPTPGPSTSSTQSHSESEGDTSESSTKPKDPNKLRKRTRNKNEDDDWQPTGDDEDDADENEEAEDEGESEYDEEEEEGDDEEDDDSSGRKRATNRQSKMRKPVKGISANRSRSPPPIKKAKTRSPAPSNPEDEDTDDEIQRVMKASPINDDNDGHQSPGSQTTGQSPNRSENLPKLPDFFENTHFFVHSKAIPSDEERLIQRLIVAFAGTLHQYMHPDVQFVVTRSMWNKEFDEALASNPNLIFVRPDWIFTCDEQAKRVPFQKFLVVG